MDKRSRRRRGPDPSLKSARFAAGLRLSSTLGTMGMSKRLGWVREFTSRPGVASSRPHAGRTRAAPAEATVGAVTAVEEVWATGASGVGDA